VVIDKTHRAIGDERVQEFVPLTKGKTLAAWSLEVGPLVDDHRCRRGANGVFCSRRAAATRGAGSQQQETQAEGKHGRERREDER